MYVPCRSSFTVTSPAESTNLSGVDIANYIYENPGLNLDLQGIWIADPSLSYDIVQGEIPTLRFVQASCRPSPCVP